MKPTDRPPSEALRFWQEVVREKRTQKYRPGTPYKISSRPTSHTAYFDDGSAVRWNRRTGEMIAFAPARDWTWAQ